MNKHEHEHKFNHLSDNELKKIVHESKHIIGVELIKKYNYFKDNCFCPLDFVSYFLTLIVQMTELYVNNLVRINPQIEKELHVVELLKSICYAHDIDIIQHKFEKSNDLH